MLNFRAFILFIVLTGLLLPACSNDNDMTQEVNVYSYRKERLIKPILDQFTRDTSIVVNLVTGKEDALFQRLQSEGKNTPADLLLTTDAGRLYRAKEAELLQPINSAVLEATIPDYLRDPNNYWFGLSYRARVIMYNKTKVRAEDLSSYEALVDEKWQKRICVRSSDNIYNQSLLASIIHHNGKQAAQQWAAGIVKNMARPPKGNDRSQMTGAVVGECDIAIANTYYLGGWIASADANEKKMAEQLGVFFPNQNGRGAHINVSGAGLIRYAKNPENAVRLLEYLASDFAQKWYAETNHEYPVNPSVAPSTIVKSWGYPFKTDTINLNFLGELNSEAVKTFDVVGWK